MVSISREDVFRSLLNELMAAASMSGETVTLPGMVTETMSKTVWYEFQLLSMVPDKTRTDNFQARGTLRVICNSRPGPTTATTDISTPYAMTDQVRSAIERKDVRVMDYASGAGLTLKGIAQIQEVQVDDLNDESNGVRPVMCTAEYLLSAEG